MLLIPKCMLSHFSHVWLFATSLTVAHQSSLSMGFSKQEYWSGLPFPSPIHVCMLSHFSRVWLCATVWTAAHQAPLSTGFSRQECWSGFPLPSPPYQATNGIFHRTRTNNFTIFMEIQKKNSNHQSNLEKEEWNCRNQPASLQTTLQSCSPPNSMVLAQRQKYRPM